MPNHTYTEVRMQGPLPIMDAMHSKLKYLQEHGDDTGFLTEFIGDPADKIPAETQDNLVKNPDVHESITMPLWYSARLKQWGTKWDVYDIRDVQTDLVAEHGGFAPSRIVTCKWHTAWSPPIPAMLELSRRHNVDIQLKYIDEGLFYVGSTTIIDGETNKEKTYEGEDVYCGVYETFGTEHFLGLCSEMQLDYLKSIHKLSKKFADTKTVRAIKTMIRDQE